MQIALRDLWADRARGVAPLLSRVLPSEEERLPPGLALRAIVLLSGALWAGIIALIVWAV